MCKTLTRQITSVLGVIVKDSSRTMCASNCPYIKRTGMTKTGADTYVCKEYKCKLRYSKEHSISHRCSYCIEDFGFGDEINKERAISVNQLVFTDRQERRDVVMESQKVKIFGDTVHYEIYEKGNALYYVKLIKELDEANVKIVKSERVLEGGFTKIYGAVEYCRKHYLDHVRNILETIMSNKLPYVGINYK